MVTAAQPRPSGSDGIGMYHIETAESKGTVRGKPPNMYALFLVFLPYYITEQGEGEVPRISISPIIY